MSDDYLFGFKWGPMTVHRILSIAGKGRLVSVATPHADVEVWVSEKGRSIRVWRNGKELS